MTSHAKKVTRLQPPALEHLPPLDASAEWRPHAVEQPHFFESCHALSAKERLRSCILVCSMGYYSQFIDRYISRHRRQARQRRLEAPVQQPRSQHLSLQRVRARPRWPRALFPPRALAAQPQCGIPPHGGNGVFQ